MPPLKAGFWVLVICTGKLSEGLAIVAASSTPSASSFCDGVDTGNSARILGALHTTKLVNPL
jgi:hypothetical protein